MTAQNLPKQYKNPYIISSLNAGWVPVHISLCARLECNNIMMWCIKGTVHPKLKIRPLFAHPCAEGKRGEMLSSTKHFWGFATKQRCSIHRRNWSRWLHCSLRSQITVNISAFKRVSRLLIGSQGFRRPNLRKMRLRSHFKAVFGCFIHILKQVPINFNCCYAVLLWRTRNVLRATNHDFPWAWVWVDNDWISYFRWAAPLTASSVQFYV